MKIFKNLLITATIAAVYYFTGWLGQALAIPPGNITLIWPPSGIAFAVLLLFGYRTLPGIFIGAFSINIFPFLVNSSQVDFLSLFISAVSISIGSCLQPILGRQLLGRFSALDELFSDQRKRLLFVLTVPAICLVSSTVGTFSLLLTGLAVQENLLLMWSTWWIGDMFGVFVFTPLVYLSVKLTYTGNKGRFYLLIGLMTGIAATIAVITLSITYNAYMESNRERLSLLAKSQAGLIDAVARFDKEYSSNDVSGGASQATLNQIRESFSRWPDFEETQEVILARQEGGRARYVLGHRSTDTKITGMIQDIDLANDEAMQQALSGRSGIVTVIDWRGVQVLAAYEPLTDLGMGLVVKKDLAEIRAPFFMAGAVAVTFAVVLIMISVNVFRRISSPLLKSLEMKYEELERLIEQRTADLQKSEEQFREFVRSAPNATIIVDSDGVIQVSNLKASEILGYSEEEFAGMKIETLVPEHLRQTHVGYRQEYTANPDLREMSNTREVMARKRDGRFLPVEIILSPIHTQEGVMIASSIRDITMRKEAEKSLMLSRQKLETSEKKFRSMVESIPGTAYQCMLDRDWTMLYISEEISRLSGYPASDFINNKIRSIASIIHPDDTERLYQAVDEAVKAGKPFIFEYRILNSRGEIRYVYEKGKALYDDDGNPEILTGTMLDITDRKLAEQEQQDSERRLSLAMHASQQFAWDVDLGQDIVRYDDDFFISLGYSPDELEKNHAGFNKIIYPEDLAFVLENRKKIEMENQQVFDLSYRVRTRDGETRWVKSTGMVADINREGRAERIFGTIRDVTNEKETQMLIQEKINELEEFNRLAVGRELRMIELKQEINQLLRDIGREEEYEIVE